MVSIYRWIYTKLENVLHYLMSTEDFIYIFFRNATFCRFNREVSFMQRRHKCLGANFDSIHAWFNGFSIYP